MGGVKIGHPLVARLVEDGEVAAHHHALAHRADGFDKITKVGHHLRGAAGQIDAINISGTEPVEHTVDCFAGDDLLAFRPCVHMAVHAGEIAEATGVELEDVWCLTSKAQAVLGESGF